MCKRVDGINQISGLTKDEDAVLDTLCAAWDAWCRLPVQHVDDTRDVADAIHRVQDILCTRIARRAFPLGWPTKPEPGPLED